MDDHNHQQIARLAYQFWLERGCPVGSSHEDWFRAERALQSSRIEDGEANAGKGGPVQIAADMSIPSSGEPCYAGSQQRAEV
jgi:hypothetical protein